MRLARTDPNTAFEAALAWQELGGGEAARHCSAVALIGLGQYGQAATRLEDLAKAMKAADGPSRAAILGQADAGSGCSQTGMAGPIWNRSRR